MEAHALSVKEGCVREIDATQGGETFTTPCGVFKYSVRLEDVSDAVSKIAGGKQPKTQTKTYRASHARDRNEVFEKLGNLDDLCFTPGQIQLFCSTYGNEFLQNHDRPPELLFLFREGDTILRDKSNLFIAKAAWFCFDDDENDPEGNPGGWSQTLELTRFSKPEFWWKDLKNTLFVIPHK
ncbi:MAG: hypothetical protein PHV93_02595 [Candidatus Pacebacteria bacterium]|nr:hypothetical protein [Candidatus Paceibacterota bacterium]